MSDPKKMSNYSMALSIELWIMTNNYLTESQKEFFDEVVWRLLLTPDKEQEKSKNE